MSYCRFSEADAYIYDDVSYGLYCCACSLAPKKTIYNSFFKETVTMHQGFEAGYDYDLMLNHIAEHREAGDYIPTEVDETLQLERDCTHEYDEKNYCSLCFRRKELP
jgi:hypothetical protein